MRSLVSLGVIAALGVSGCAASVANPPRQVAGVPVGELGLILRFDSEPRFATVMRDGVVLGRTPFERAVPVTRFSEDGVDYLACTSTGPLTFVWESGASTTVSDVCRSYPTVTATRPADAPGLKQDLRAESRYRATYGRALPQSSIWTRTPPPYMGLVGSYSYTSVSGREVILPGLERTASGAYGVSSYPFTAGVEVMPPPEP